MKSEYRGSKHQAKNQTVPIRVDDPRLSALKIGQTKARLGAEIDLVGINNKLMVVGGMNVTGSPSGNGTGTGVTVFPDIIIPPMGGNGPTVYPNGSGPYVIIPTDPSAIVAVWGTYSAGTFTAGTGDDLQVSFTYDTTITANITMSNFSVKLGTSSYTVSSSLFSLNKSSSSQVAVITRDMNTQLFNKFTTSLTSICVQISDPLLNISNVVCAASVPAYVLGLNAPTISVANVNNGYTVTVTNTSEMAKGSFDAIDIWEIESTAGTAPTITYGSDGVTPSNYSRVYFSKINPAPVICPNLNKRWVVARFSSLGSVYTGFSTAYAATPVSPVTVDNIPPSESTVVLSAWGSNSYTYNGTGSSASTTLTISSTTSLVAGMYVVGDGIATGTTIVSVGTGNIVLSLAPTTTLTTSPVTFISTTGDNLYIGYKINDATAARFVAQLTSPVSSVGYFYIYPVGSSTTQIATISKNDLFNQFGDYYSSFTGVFKSIDSSDNRSAGVNFTVVTRANPLAGITPTATAVSISNGYTVSFNLPTAASYGEVYQKATTWSGITSPVDYYTSTFSSGGTSGTNSLLINTIKDNNSNAISTAMPTGYFITGTGIPANTFVSAVSGTTTQTLTLSTYDSTGTVVASNLTTQAAGTYTLTSLVYSGIGPATIPLQLYGNEYIIVRYYDSFHNSSNVSVETIVKPINPAVVDNTVPSAPTVVQSTITVPTANTITVKISTADVTTKGYRVRYKKSTDTLYTTDIIPITTISSTEYTINNLISGTSYTISAAGYNQYNGVGTYPTDVSISTTTPTVSVPTGVTLTAETYGFLATWTAPATPVTPVSQYKIELYNSANTLIMTDYTYSTTYSFTGLKASTTYYVKVYTQDVYAKLSAAVQSSNISLNAAGQTTDGSAPASSPAATVNPLYGALEVKWTAISNADPVTYEVHVSTTTGFTPDRVGTTTLALKTSGTFAVIKTLPGITTALTYGTTYYVKIVATDFDGAAAAGTQGSAAPLTVSSSDITANTITANNIAAGTITSTEINSASLLVGKLFAVGTTTDTYAIKIDATANTVKLYGGTGTYQNSNTGFYLDTTGKFSIKDKLWIDGSVANTVVNTTTSGSTASGSYTIIVTSATGIVTGMYVTSAAGIPTPTLVTGVSGTTITLSQKTTAIIATTTAITFTSSPTLTVNGTINAQSGVFGGAISAGDMKLGAAVNSTNNGIYINANNYWYDTGNIKIGGANNNVTWDGTNFDVTGSINAQRGVFSGPVLIGGSGYILAATSYTVSAATTGPTVGFTTSTGTWAAGQIVTITGAVPSSYNGTFTILASPTPTTTTFSVTNAAATTAWQFGGTVMVSSGSASRIQIAPSAISAYDAGGNLTTQIVSNATNGANTFITSNAKIADWTISASKIESTLVAGITKYTGLSASNTSYAFWAGATTAGNTDNTAPFSVTPAGSVLAKNIQIVGGQLDIGASSYTYTGSGSTASTILTVSSTTSLVAGMYVVGYGIASGTTISVVGTGQVTLSAAPTTTLTNSSVTFISANGAHITSAGSLYATSATISGAITATSGSFTGNVLLNGGSLYAPGAGGTATTGIRTVFNSAGMAAYDASGNYAQMLTTPLADGSIFAATSANIGGWIVNGTAKPGAIYKTGITGKGNIVLDSTNGYIYTSDSAVSTYSAGINSTSSIGDVAFWAGSATSASQPAPAATTQVNASAATVAGSAVLGSIVTTGITAGMLVGGAGLAGANTTFYAIVTYVDSANSRVYLNQPVFTTGTSTYNFYRYNNNYVVLGNGTIIAKNAFLNGTLSTSGQLGAITIDSDKDLISLSNGTAGQSYIIPRNGNLYITAPSSNTPFSTGTAIDPTNGPGGSNPVPYFAAGAAFKDPYNNTVQGIGLFVGNWNYSAGASTKPFINLYAASSGTAQQGVQISASSKIGILVESETSTNNPGILLYTGTDSANSYKPSTGAGALAFAANMYITPNSIAITASKIRNATVIPNTQAAIGTTVASDSAYRGSSQIVLDTTNTLIKGLPIQGDVTLNYAQWQANFTNTTVNGFAPQTGYTSPQTGYLGVQGLGPVPRQRMLVEDPVSGVVKLGMAVYYQDTGVSPSAPSYTGGFIGDLWVQY